MFGFCQKMDTPFEIIRYVLSPCGSESPFVRSYVDLQSTQLTTHLRPGGAPGVTPIRWGGLPRHIDFCLDCRSANTRKTLPAPTRELAEKIAEIGFST